MLKRQKLYKKQRLQLFALVGVLVISAFSLILYAMQDNLYYFYTPKDIMLEKPKLNKTMRLGGLVKKDSIVKEGLATYFTIIDGEYEIAVSYNGTVPSLFRDGQGVIVTGKLQSAEQFIAQELLAKHDENYMPKEVADRLKENGTWQGVDK